MRKQVESAFLNKEQIVDALALKTLLHLSGKVCQPILQGKALFGKLFLVERFKVDCLVVSFLRGKKPAEVAYLFE